MGHPAQHNKNMANIFSQLWLFTTKTQLWPQKKLPLVVCWWVVPEKWPLPNGLIKCYSSSHEALWMEASSSHTQLPLAIPARPVPCNGHKHTYD